MANVYVECYFKNNKSVHDKTVETTKSSNRTDYYTIVINCAI